MSVIAALITAVFVTRGSMAVPLQHAAVSPRIHGCAAPQPAARLTSGERPTP